MDLLGATLWLMLWLLALLLLLLFLEARWLVVGVAVLETAATLVGVATLVVAYVGALAAVVPIALVPVGIDYAVVVSTSAHVALVPLLGVFPSVVDAVQPQVTGALAAHAVMIVVKAGAITPLLVAGTAVAVAVVITVEARLSPARQRLALVAILAASHGWILVGVCVYAGWLLCL